MEKLFWAATTTYFTSLYAAIKHSPNYILLTFLLFLLIPSLTKTQTVPGIKQHLTQQIQVLQEMKKQ